MGKSVMSRTLSVHQEHELLLKLEAAGLTADDAQRVITAKDNVVAEWALAAIRGENAPDHQTLTISVDYTKPVSVSLTEGNYDSVHPLLTDDDFSVASGCCSNHCCCPHTEQVEVHLVHFDKVTTSGEVEEELNKQGLRPATVEELLALGAQHPDLQRQFPIVALGSECVGRLGDRSVPELWGDSRARLAHVHWRDDRWDADCRFLAVRK